MADQHDRALRCAASIRFQPFDGRQIEVVGRLVQQQDARRGRQDMGERRAPDLAAGQPRRILVARQAELLQQIARLIGIVARPKPGARIVERRRMAGQVRLLRQIADGGAGLHEPVPRSASISPAAILSSVDLPEPLRPTRQSRSPAETDNSAPSSSGVPPKVSANVGELQKRGSHEPSGMNEGIGTYSANGAECLHRGVRVWLRQVKLRKWRERRRECYQAALSLETKAVT